MGALVVHERHSGDRSCLWILSWLPGRACGPLVMRLLGFAPVRISSPLVPPSLWQSCGCVKGKIIGGFALCPSRPGETMRYLIIRRCSFFAT